MSEHPPGEWSANLRFDPTAFVAPGAMIAGDVTLGPRSSVWFNCVIRGDGAPVSVGRDSNVQDGTVVHVDEGFPAVIGAAVTIGHRAIIHGCVIEDECLIGMGAVILTGATVGRGSLVGAGALVREGQAIPPGSLAIGAPARIVGPVTDAHRDAIRRGARHYVELSRSYLRRGFARPHPARRADGGTPSRDRGPMTFFEWEQLIAALAGGPGRAKKVVDGVPPERALRAPALERWSAHEVVCHLRDSDDAVLVPRLARFLAEDEPFFADVDMTGWDTDRGYRDQRLPEVLAEWSASRARAVGMLEPLGRAEWGRLAFHSVRGPYPLAEMVRSWVEHDLAHLRQMEEALGAGRT